MTMPPCDHLVYVDDRGSYATLHLTVECGRAGVATSHDVDVDHCAAALDDWLRANTDRTLLELLVTTSRVHHGRLGPVVDVLARHRPTVHRLGLGAIPSRISGAAPTCRTTRGATAPRGTSRCRSTACSPPCGISTPDVVDLGYQRIRIDGEVYFDPPLVGLFDAWR